VDHFHPGDIVVMRVKFSELCAGHHRRRVCRRWNGRRAEAGPPFTTLRKAKRLLKGSCSRRGAHPVSSLCAGGAIVRTPRQNVLCSITRRTVKIGTTMSNCISTWYHGAETESGTLDYRIVWTILRVYLCAAFLGSRTPPFAAVGD